MHFLENLGMYIACAGVVSPSNSGSTFPAPPHPVQRAASLEEALSPDMRAGGPQQEGLAGTPGPPETPHVTGMVVQQVLQSWGPRQPPASLLWILGPYIPVLSLGLDSSQSRNIMLMLKPVLSWLPVIPGLLSQNMAG